ncbi:hypothetical protein [Caulobacter sp. UNC279MFTsu5.1]|uniref:hypothetical protein n=1 Tax=Caulobacter sp. UNC279MFTsu5.1 TaxID=1502775 RepID=UPI0003706F90|nr:hypothetical protein [Caulobacter sp. UNC279MFTsu5.1]SFJ47974.1 hypothetical protein SAMN02799626_01893 [Caulobacter sp. UNC279MFTsu5.1]
MLKKILVAACLATCGIAAPAAATDAAEGYIVGVMPMRNGVVIFSQTGVRTGTPPACHGVGYGWSLNAGTVAGQAQLAALLSAQARGKKIVIIGMGSCADWPDTEAINYFRIVD